MAQHPLRIVVSGPSGSGKSTLVRALAEEFDLVAIEEGMLPLYETRGRFLQSARPPAAPIEQQLALREAWINSFFAWCSNRAERYASASYGFIADRWELDLYGNWLRIFSAYQLDDSSNPDERTRKLGELVRMRATTIDLAILLPPAEAKVEARNDAGLRRVSDLASQLLSYNMALGMFQQLPDSLVRYVPPAVEPVDKRVADIRGLIGQATAARGSR